MEVSEADTLLPHLKLLKDGGLPLLFLFGQKNRGRFPCEARLRAAGLPVEFIASAGHAMHSDNPVGFYGVVRRFCEENNLFAGSSPVRVKFALPSPCPTSEISIARPISHSAPASPITKVIIRSRYIIPAHREPSMVCQLDHSTAVSTAVSALLSPTRYPTRDASAASWHSNLSRF